MDRAEHIVDLLDGFRRCVSLYESEDLSAAEVVNKVLVDLAAFERCDLVTDTIGLLPDAIRQELRRTVANVLRAGSEYQGPFMIGRAAEEWRTKVRAGVTRLATMFSALLDGPDRG